LQRNFSLRGTPTPDIALLFSRDYGFIGHELRLHPIKFRIKIILSIFFLF
jgi:hypothetical protein